MSSSWWLLQVDPDENMISFRAAKRDALANKEKENTASDSANGRVRRKALSSSLADDMLKACQEANPTVNKVQSRTPLIGRFHGF